MSGACRWIVDEVELPHIERHPSYIKPQIKFMPISLGWWMILHKSSEFQFHKYRNSMWVVKYYNLHYDMIHVYTIRFDGVSYVAVNWLWWKSRGSNLFFSSNHITGTNNYIFIFSTSFVRSIKGKGWSGAFVYSFQMTDS